MPNRPVQAAVPSQVQPPPFYLNAQQIQMLQYLQKNKDNLNPQQQTLLQQLMHRYQMMQQHQHQLRLQQQQQQQQIQMQTPVPGQQMMVPQQSNAQSTVMQMQQPIKSDQDMQAILSQTESKTAIAENLLKQFSTIKEEIIDDDKNMMADSTTNINSNLQHTIKCEATSTSSRSPIDIKNEPTLKIENIFETNRKVSFHMHMDSKQIAEAIK